MRAPANLKETTMTSMVQSISCRVLVAILALVIVTSVTGAANEEAPGISAEFAGIPYVETLTGGASEGNELPMLIALHYMSGSPATSIADYGNVEVPARLLSLAGPHRFDDGYSWFPDGYYELDVAAQSSIALDVAKNVVHFIEEAIEAYPTRGKPVLTGYSQGADLIHLIALHRPGLISAGLPMGGRFPDAWHEAIAGDSDVPSEIALFHGAADRAVDVGESLSAAEYYTAHGATVTLHTYAGVGHAYPAQMKSDFKNISERLLQVTGE